MITDNVLNKLEDHRQEIAEEKLQRFRNYTSNLRRSLHSIPAPDGSNNKLSAFARGFGVCSERLLVGAVNSWPQAAADRDPENEGLAALVSFFASKDNSFFGL